MKTRPRAVVRPSAAPPKAPAANRPAVPATPFPALSPPWLLSRAAHVQARPAVAMVEIGKSPLTVLRVHPAAQALQIAPVQNAEAMEVTERIHPSAPAHLAARGPMTVSMPQNDPGRLVALVLATDPGPEIALPALLIAPAHPAALDLQAVRVLRDAPVHPSAVARENLVVAGAKTSLPRGVDTCRAHLLTLALAGNRRSTP